VVLFLHCQYSVYPFLRQPGIKDTSFHFCSLTIRCHVSRMQVPLPTHFMSSFSGGWMSLPQAQAPFPEPARKCAEFYLLPPRPLLLLFPPHAGVLFMILVSVQYHNLRQGSLIHHTPHFLLVRNWSKSSFLKILLQFLSALHYLSSLLNLTPNAQN
jgi:hypothetical protein